MDSDNQEHPEKGQHTRASKVKSKQDKTNCSGVKGEDQFHFHISHMWRVESLEGRKKERRERQKKKEIP
ncbi:hypothetical protein EYC80_002061 [Monilinia laxa]|uniref:Uncharacterized protein n=1 Tax=Monilinia laxa TaxID=61186 RepID=A0A5N6K6X8_MONLA|nr:hypothetical protein EYC80_002061 [Monilinia laxa]